MPTLGKSVEYAIHSLVYFVDQPQGQTISVHDLASFQKISETYLAKVFTRLKKYGIVQSNIGVKGGFSLNRPPEDISFYDIAMAVEGEISFFECKNIRDNCVVFDQKTLPWEKGDLCAIHKAMLEVEETIKDSLRTRNLRWLHDAIQKNAPQEYSDEVLKWFGSNDAK